MRDKAKTGFYGKNTAVIAVVALLTLAGCVSDSAKNQVAKPEKAIDAALALVIDNPVKPMSDVPVPAIKENAFSAQKSKNIAGSMAVQLQSATPEVETLIRQYANAYHVPEDLVRRIVKRESNGNPKARNGPYYGLMQIALPTAQRMGYTGPASGLLDAETNLRYGVKYLAGAYIVAEGNHDLAVRYYAKGYYYEAKSKNLLEETAHRQGAKTPKTAFVKN